MAGVDRICTHWIKLGENWICKFIKINGNGIYCFVKSPADT